MNKKRFVICKGDRTTHGGIVIEGTKSGFTIDGKCIAQIFDLVSCPKCKGVYHIIEGTTKLSYHGENVAVEGMYTSCGAQLIASQKRVKA